MNAPYLPPVARPPHDPLSMVLDARLGWRGGALAGVVHDVEVDVDGSVALQALPGSGRTLGESSGSFGGLVLPRTMAWLPDGRLLLLDATAERLLVFDPCTCRFEPHACIGDGDVRVPAGTTSIAVVGNALFLCVPAAHRVIVLDAATGATRAVWRHADGSPVACIGWHHGLVAVADAVAGGVHVCSRNGRVLRFIGGLGAVDALAVDFEGRLYVRSAGRADVVVVDGATGRVVDNPLRPDVVADRFPTPRVRVFADGAIDLGPLCPTCDDEAVTPKIFDLHGRALPDDYADAEPVYPPLGTWISAPLDSAIAACTWDRIALHARLPAGSAIEIATRTADQLLTDDELADGAMWRTAGTWQADVDKAPAGSNAPSAQPGCETADYMLRSPAGRYLWLKLTLMGGTRSTPRIGCLQIDFPRISLRRYLPAVFGADPVAAEFTDRWLAILDRGLRDIETQVDRQAALFDPMSAPAAPEVPANRDFLALLAAWVGVTLVAAWPLARKRRFVQQMPRLYPWRGTMGGLRASLQLFLGLDLAALEIVQPDGCVPCQVREARRTPLGHAWRAPRLLLENFQLRRWMALDHARLSDAARLWGERIVDRSRLESDVDLERTGRTDGAQLGVTQLNTSQDPERDPFYVTAHRLSIFVPAACARSPAIASALKAFVEAEKPAHVKATLVFVEPRFRVGVQSMLGLDAVIGFRTQPVTLDAARLGRATVLGSDARGQRAPTHLGATRIGMTTVMR